MLNINNLIDWSYLASDPEKSFYYQDAILVFLLVCLVAGTVLMVLAKRFRNLWSRVFLKLSKIIALWLIWPSAIGILLVFFRNQNITVFSWRLWFEILAFCWLWGIIYILYYLIFTYRVDRAKELLLSIKKKYLP